MAFQVTIYNERERAAYKKKMTVPVGAGRWKDGRLLTDLHKPGGNMLDRKTWIAQLARCIELSMTKEQFLEKLGDSFDRYEQDVKRAVEATGMSRRYFLKESGHQGDYNWIEVTYGDTYRLIRGLYHKEMISVRRALGW